MPTLADYLAETRRLLHDANQNFWSDSDLTAAINDARNRVVSDTACNRLLQSINLVTPTELYPWSSLPSGSVTIDILNITILWSGTRVPLVYMPYTELNMKLRVWTTFISRPVAYSVYGTAFYIGPVPDMTYPAEVDTVVLPGALTSQSQADTLIYPFTSPVAYFAAHKAKFQEQSYNEADMYLQQYNQQVQMALRASMTRRLGNGAYGRS